MPQTSFFDRLAARIPSMLEECSWATGNAVRLTGPQPPPWVKNTILKVIGYGYLRPLSECNPAKSGQLSAEQVGLLVGAGQVLARMFLHPDERHREEEKRLPEMGELRRKIVASLPSAFEKTGAKKKGKAKPLPEIATAEQVMSCLSGFKKGGSQAMGVSSGFEGQPMFFQLGLLVWVFWQDVELARNRRDLAQWLQSMGVACSFATVEKFCREVNLKLAPRGRAKKMLLGRKKT